MCFSFCLLASTLLIYYSRLRYNLRVSIWGFPRQNLWMISYQNHIKNLKIKCTIANFAIIILLVEIANNGSILIETILQFSDHCQAWNILNHVRFISKYSLIPLLCMLLDVLWLAYLHSQYKYTIMRWTAYIILRIVVLNILYQVRIHVANSNIEYVIYWSLNIILLLICELIDLLTYIWYSRRFYRHLKSRELEAKLFMSRREYLENKYVCMHFKIATIFVTISLATYLLPNVFYPFTAVFQYNQWVYYDDKLIVWPITSCQLLSRILFNFNYLYLIVVSAYRYWRQKHGLTRVNDRIQPLVRKYQDKIYQRYNK